MISRPAASANVRQGTISVLAAILAVPLLGMVAFVVDYGWIVHTQNELQSAADAAALAGAAYLADGWVQYYTPGQSTSLQQFETNSKILPMTYDVGAGDPGARIKTVASIRRSP